MRKHQQKQILELLETVREAQSAKLYADCQDGALAVAGYIGDIEGEGTETEALLVDYCELVFKASNGEIGENTLRRHLNKIENSVNDELKPNRIEIAFLSYKASMSDSIESIYLAAKADPDCDAFWMPIPYYDKNTDGSFGKMHYEGAECYGDNIECTDWRKYDIKARRPDVIFTFNPYDADNLVTSVHRDFYCERLHKLTDMLVYVPYFVSYGDEKKLFCVLSGTVFADRVFLASERSRDIYINSFKDFDEENNCKVSSGKPEDKFIASGSPKFDKVINTKPGDFNLPDEWARLIVCPDGTRKKTVLYNTSINSILKGNERYLKKLVHTLETFRTRDNVVLWWRPHPLNEATFSAMLPGLFNEYRNVIDQYRKCGFGIYDDTPDLHRAISLSDAYYGDTSSLIPLYQCREKPIIVQNINALDKDDITENIPISFIYETGGVFWCTALTCNALFKTDKDFTQAEFIGSFPGEKTHDWRLYSDIIEYGDLLCFAPQSAEKIAIFDRESANFQSIDIPVPGEINNLKVTYNEEIKFVKILEVDGQIFIAPHTFPGILILDSFESQPNVIDSWLKSLEPLIFDASCGYFSNAVIDARNTGVYFVCANANAVVELNIKTHETAVHKLGSDNNGYMDILFVEDKFWLLSRNKASIACWDPFGKVHEEYYIHLEGIPQEGFILFQRLVYMENSLMLIPLTVGRMIKFDLTDHTFAFSESFAVGETESSNAGYIYMRSYCSKNIYIQKNVVYDLIEFDPLSGSKHEHGLRISNQENREKLREHLVARDNDIFKKANDCLFMENPYGVTLDIILDSLTLLPQPDWLSKQTEKQADLRLSEIVHGDGKAGQEILDICKKAVLKH